MTFHFLRVSGNEDRVINYYYSSYSVFKKQRAWSIKAKASRRKERERGAKGRRERENGELPGVHVFPAEVQGGGGRASGGCEGGLQEVC